MIGGSRQSVSRLLSDLAGQGLVRIERDSIVIPDVDALARAAER
jgi:DNA-binding transcriptional regulator LsrR (DeoR family)